MNELFTLAQTNPDAVFGAGMSPVTGALGTVFAGFGLTIVGGIVLLWILGTILRPLFYIMSILHMAFLFLKSVFGVFTSVAKAIWRVCRYVWVYYREHHVGKVGEASLIPTGKPVGLHSNPE